MSPYCEKTCGHLVKKKRFGRVSYLCTMYNNGTVADYFRGISKIKVLHKKLEKDGDMVIKCGACMRAEERRGANA
jgi:hypothetical protein